ncbi:MAG: hypothetical protein ABSH49_25770 [Bryobacteraceae bacterium]|jgi:hypothetical protein
MTTTTLAALLLGACTLSGAERYFFEERLAALDRSHWVATGSPSSGDVGFAAADVEGASLIWSQAVPDGTFDAEVRASIKLTGSGGRYTEYLRATPDARTGGSGAGSYLAFEMRNPTFDPSGACAATFSILQRVGGVVSVLSSFQHGCHDGMEMRFAIHGNLAVVWLDGSAPSEFPTAAPASGQPGIGAAETPAGNAVSAVRLGLVAHAAPAAVAEETVGVSAFRNRVDVQWVPVVANAFGGAPSYWIYRDGDYLLRTVAHQFSDEAVSPGSQHTYTIYAVDEDFNFSPGTSVTATAPVPIPGTNAAPPPPKPAANR